MVLFYAVVLEVFFHFQVEWGRALGFERLLHDDSDLGIFAGHNLRAPMKDGDATAKAPKHLAKFEADVAAPEN